MTSKSSRPSPGESTGPVVTTRTIQSTTSTTTNVLTQSLTLPATSPSTSPFHLVGRKLQKQLSSMLVESVSAPVSTFAQKQLAKMGWQPGQAVGKRRNDGSKHHTGLKTHIRVQRRPDRVGLGISKSTAAMSSSSKRNISSNSNHQQQSQSHHVAMHLNSNEGDVDFWWKSSLSSTLAKLSNNKKKDDVGSHKAKKDKKKSEKAKKKKRKSDDKEATKSSSDDNNDDDEGSSSIVEAKAQKNNFTDQDLFEATGGARFGMRAKLKSTTKLAKWTRSESEISYLNHTSNSKNIQAKYNTKSHQCSYKNIIDATAESDNAIDIDNGAFDVDKCSHDNSKDEEALVSDNTSNNNSDEIVSTKKRKKDKSKKDSKKKKRKIT